MCQEVGMIRSVQPPLRITETGTCADNAQDSSGSAHYEKTNLIVKKGPLPWTDAREMAYHDPTE